jgi:hypothetical protein
MTRAVKLSEAQKIYDEACARAMKDHKHMVRKFMRGEIEIASPCGMDRERDYIIKAFAGRLALKDAGE